MSTSSVTSDRKLDLKSVQSRIRRCQSRVRDVDIFEGYREIIVGSSLQRKLNSQASLRREVHRVGTVWNVMIGEKHSSSQLQVGHGISDDGEVVLHIERR